MTLRKGDAGLSILALIVVVSSLIQWGLLMTLPGQFENMIDTQLGDMDPVVKSTTVKTYVEEGYFQPAAEYAVYEAGSAELGTWSTGQVPDESEVFDSVMTAVNDQFRDNYIGTLRSGANCELAGADEVSLSFSEEGTESGEDVMRFEVDGGPLDITCEGRQISIRNAGVRGMQSSDMIQLPDQVAVPGVRYQTLASAAHTVASETLLPTALSSAGDETALQNELDNIADTYEDRFDDIDVSLEIDSFEAGGTTVMAEIADARNNVPTSDGVEPAQVQFSYEYAP